MTNTKSHKNKRHQKDLKNQIIKILKNFTLNQALERQSNHQKILIIANQQKNHPQIINKTQERKYENQSYLFQPKKKRKKKKKNQSKRSAWNVKQIQSQASAHFYLQLLLRNQKLKPSQKNQKSRIIMTKIRNQKKAKRNQEHDVNSFLKRKKFD